MSERTPSIGRRRACASADDQAEAKSFGPPFRAIQTAPDDKRAVDRELDQFYTLPDIAEYFVERFQKRFDPAFYLMVEPSAGTGSFFRLLPTGSIGYDVDPKCAGLITADFLKVRINSDQKIAIIGNPPFGKNSSMAVRFFNHAAQQATVIAMILPMTFRKASIQNRLDRAFHLLSEETVPDNAFLFRSKPYDVPATFQIWERRSEPRPLWHVETNHSDFEFTTPCRADFAIQRVGARAGRVHHDFTKSPASHYFIRGNVEGIMAQLDFTSVANSVVGNPSLSKSEIISMYCEHRNAI